MSGTRSYLSGSASFLLAVLLLMIFGAGPLAAEDYLLGPMDKLHIRVSEWQSADATVREWPSITGDYTVGPGGTISLPFVGALPASGKSPEAISEAIEDELQQKLGLLNRPDASVELAEFRPVYIAGDVQAPGRYPYEPGLTVVKAVSLAGGLRRAASEGMRVERDYINASGNRRVMEAERNRLLARRARLRAESQEQDTVQMPEELAGVEDGKALIAKESAFMKSRRESFTRQLTNLEELQSLLRSQIESLDKKLVTQKRQIDLSKEQLEGIGGLADRGLVVNERVLSMERSVAEMEGKVLDMETAQLQARQDINEAERDVATLRDERQTDIARELQETEAEIEELDLKVGMYRDLMAEAASQAPEAALGGNDTSEIEYRVMRGADDEQSEVIVGETEPVQPGDVVKVAIVPSAVQ